MALDVTRGVHRLRECVYDGVDCQVSGVRGIFRRKNVLVASGCWKFALRETRSFVVPLLPLLQCAPRRLARASLNRTGSRGAAYGRIYGRGGYFTSDNYEIHEKTGESCDASSRQILYRVSAAAAATVREQRLPLTSRAIFKPGIESNAPLARTHARTHALAHSRNPPHPARSEANARLPCRIVVASSLLATTFHCLRAFLGALHLQPASAGPAHGKVHKAIR